MASPPKITKKDFVIKSKDAIKQDFNSEKYYLALLSEKDYEDIIIGLVALYKRRARDAGKRTSDKHGNMKNHKAKITILVKDIDDKQARVIAETTSSKAKTNSATLEIISSWCKSMEELEKQKDSEEVKSQTDNENSDEDSKNEKHKKTIVRAKTKTENKRQKDRVK